MVPKHTVRQELVPVVDLSEEEAEDFKEKAASVEGNASEWAARRAGVPHNSARLDYFGGECLGLGAGGRGAECSRRGGLSGA